MSATLLGEFWASNGSLDQVRFATFATFRGDASITMAISTGAASIWMSLAVADLHALSELAMQAARRLDAELHPAEHLASKMEAAELAAQAGMSAVPTLAERFPHRPVTEVSVCWCDDTQMRALAKDRGWSDEGGGPSILDLVDEGECEKSRGFPSVTKAKEWARRNKTRDLWGQPAIYVYQWPTQRKLSWERETVRYLRYVGDGYGWDEVQ